MDNIQTTLERLLLIGTTLLQLANNNTLITPIGPEQGLEQGQEQGRVPVTIENLQNLLNALNKLHALSSKDIRNKLSKIDNIIDTNINNDAELTRQLGEYGFIITPGAIFIRMQEPPIAQAVQTGIQALQPGIQAVQSGIQAVQPGIQAAQPGIQAAQEAAQEAINAALEAINAATTAAENTRHTKDADDARAGAQHAQDALNQATAPALIPQTEAQAERASLSSLQQAVNAAYSAKQAVIIAQKAGEENVSAILPRGPQAAITLAVAGIIQSVTQEAMLAAEQAQRVPNEQKTLLTLQVEKQALLAENIAIPAVTITQTLANGTAYQAEGVEARRMLQSARVLIQAASAIQGQPETRALEYARAVQQVSLAAYKAANVAARALLNPQAEQAQIHAQRAAQAGGLAIAAADRSGLAATRAQIALGIPRAQELYEARQAATRAEVASEVAKMVVNRAKLSIIKADREPANQANLLAELAILAAKQAILVAGQITQGTTEEQATQIANDQVSTAHQLWIQGAPPGQSAQISSEASLKIAMRVTKSAGEAARAAARATIPPLGGPAAAAAAPQLGGAPAAAAAPLGAAPLGAAPAVVAPAVVAPLGVAAAVVAPAVQLDPPAPVEEATVAVAAQLDPPAPVEEATTNILQTLQNVNEVSIFTDTTIIKKLLKLDNTSNIDQLEDSFRTNFNIIITDEGISINIAN